jgi:hypothetical protein
MSRRVRVMVVSALAAAVFVMMQSCGVAPSARLSGAVSTLARGGVEHPGTEVDGRAPGSTSAVWDAYVPFVAAEGLAVFDTPATSWSIVDSPAPGADEIARLAERLGVDGTPVAHPADAPSGDWTVGDHDEGAFLYVNTAPPWWWSWRAAAEPIERDRDPSFDADEAAADALDLFEHWGYDRDQLAITTRNADAGIVVTGALTFDGVPSSLTVSASFAGDGTLNEANGYLAQPQRSQEMARIGTLTAVRQIGRRGVSCAVADFVRDAPPSVQRSCVPSDPHAYEPSPIEIVAVSEYLQVANAETEAPVLLPAYRLAAADGGVLVQFAVDVDP